MKIFGYDLKLTKAGSQNLKQLDVEPNGSAVASKALAQIIDFDFIARSEVDLVNSYRRISYMTEVSTAIDEIVNEIIVVDSDEDVIRLDTTLLKDEAKLPDNLIEEVEEAFKEICDLLDMNSTAYSKVRDWYIDGKIIFQKVIDTSKPKKGIQKLVQLDPRKVRRVTIVTEDSDGMLTVDDEFYVYTAAVPDKENRLSSSFSVQMSNTDFMDLRRTNLIWRIEKDAITFVDSGMIDKGSGISYGYLHKAVKVANQLDLVETSLIIYRLSRASERRVIYVDPGNLPPSKAMQHLENIKAEFRNKTYYDTVQGSTEDKARVMSLQEDFFMLRNGSKTTEVQPLSGAMNLGNIEDIDHFKDKLFLSLNVPSSRFRESNSLFSSGTNISRDEQKFHRFITRLRAQFNGVFIDLLRTHLILKKVMHPDEFEEIKSLLRFKYNKDSFFSEIRDLEELERRLSTLEAAKPYIGVYFPNDYIRNKILGQTREDIEEFDKKIAEERKSQEFRNRQIDLPDDTIDYDQKGQRNRADDFTRSTD